MQSLAIAFTYNDIYKKIRPFDHIDNYAEFGKKLFTDKFSLKRC